MKCLHPDDYTPGKLVTVLEQRADPMMTAFGMPFEAEKTELCGRVFEIICYDPPWIILKPLDGIGDVPVVQKIAGGMAFVQRVIIPAACRCNAAELTLAEVSPEYVKAFKKYFCSNDENNIPRPPADPASSLAATMPLLADMGLNLSEKQEQQTDTPDKIANGNGNHTNTNES